MQQFNPSPEYDTLSFMTTSRNSRVRTESLHLLRAHVRLNLTLGSLVTNQIFSSTSSLVHTFLNPDSWSLERDVHAWPVGGTYCLGSYQSISRSDGLVFPGWLWGKGLFLHRRFYIRLEERRRGRRIVSRMLRRLLDREMGLSFWDWG